MAPNATLISAMGAMIGAHCLVGGLRELGAGVTPVDFLHELGAANVIVDHLRELRAGVLPVVLLHELLRVELTMYSSAFCAS